MLLWYILYSSGPVLFCSVILLFQTSDPLCSNLSRQRAGQCTWVPSAPHGSRQHLIFMGLNVGQVSGSLAVSQQEVPTGFPLMEMNSQVASGRLGEALQGLLITDVPATCHCPWPHTTFQVPALLPFSTDVACPSRCGIFSFLSHFMTYPQLIKTQLKFHLHQEALVSNLSY